MPYIRNLLRVLKRAKHAYSAKTSTTGIECSIPVLRAYCSSQDIAEESIEDSEKRTFKARVKHAIIHKASRIPRWTGTGKAVASKEEDTVLIQQPPFIPLSQYSMPSEGDLGVSVGIRKAKSAFSKVKHHAFRMVSRIPRPRQDRLKISVALPLSLRSSDVPTTSGSSKGLDVFITTHIETEFFNEEDLLAIINPVIEEPETVVWRYAPSRILPRDEPFPFTHRFSYARPNSQQRVFPVDRCVEASVSTSDEEVKFDGAVEDVCVDKLIPLVEALSTDEYLQLVRPSLVPNVVAEVLVVPQEDTGSVAAEDVTANACPILSNSSKFIYPAGSDSSSLSTSNESGAEPISSATGSPVSLISTLDQPQKVELVGDLDDALDSDDKDSSNHFKRIHTTGTNYPCIESWYNDIIDELKRAGGLNRSPVTSRMVGIKDDVKNTAANRDIHESSKETIRKSDFEIGSVAAGALCDPTSLDADTAPRSISSVVNGIRLLGLPIPEDFEFSEFLTLLETAVSASSATSTSSEESPSQRAARTARGRCGAVQGKYTSGNARSPLLPPLQPTFKENPFLEEMRMRARRAAVYRSTSSHFQDFSDVSPSAHRSRCKSGYRGPLVPVISDTMAISSPSLTSMNMHRPNRPPALSVGPTAWEASPHARQHQAVLAAATSSQIRSGVRHTSLPGFTTTPSICSTPPTSGLYDVHISPTLYPSVSGTPRPSMIPRHVSLQRREWASMARLAAFALPKPSQTPSEFKSRSSMIPRHASLHQGGKWTGAGKGFGLVVPPSPSVPRHLLGREAPVPF